MIRYATLTSLAALVLPVSVSAQSVDAQVTRPQPAVATDTLRVPHTELVEGYESLLRTYSQLRRIDEAGVVGGMQDGLNRVAIDGLVVDETQTKLGRDFYTEFYAFWQAPEGAMNYTILVQEQPIPNVGTRILVRVNDEIAFQTQIQPRQEMIENAARQGVYLTYRLVQGLSSREEYVY